MHDPSIIHANKNESVLSLGAAGSNSRRTIHWTGQMPQTRAHMSLEPAGSLTEVLNVANQKHSLRLCGNLKRFPWSVLKPWGSVALQLRGALSFKWCHCRALKAGPSLAGPTKAKHFCKVLLPQRPPPTHQYKHSGEEPNSSITNCFGMGFQTNQTQGRVCNSTVQ